MFERYTQQARRAIFFARFEAVHRRAEVISTVHLLLGLSWDGDSRAVLAVPLKDKLIDICALLGIPHRPCTEVPYDRNIDLPLDRDSKKTLAYAAEEAEKDGQFWIDTDHLMRGILRFPNKTNAALEAVQLNLGTVREASKRYRAEFPAEPPPFPIPIRKSLVQGPDMVARPFLTVSLLALVQILVLLLLAWFK
jgi:ATP-dependent Clp protease ATP-binding subunit ClpC